MTILSIDPSLINTAFVISKVDRLGNMLPFGYIMSKSPKSKDKKKLIMDDRIDRIHNHFENLEKVVSTYSPDVICLETPSGSQSSAAAISIGYALSLAARCKQIGKTVTCKPNDVKKYINAKTADKKEVITYIDGKYENFLPTKKDKSLHLGESEHIADAIVVAEFCLNQILNR
jgi:Holliday junction resolvasome RuvABC endonuclease subunit